MLIVTNDKKIGECKMTNERVNGVLTYKGELGWYTLCKGSDK